MTCFICETCGTQFNESDRAPTACPICEDDRQYVGWEGQRWTTPEALRARHTLRIAEDAGLLGLDITPSFAIPQRALLLPTDAGNILWECLSLVTDEAVATLKAHGGVDRIIISHPHFYSAMVDWSEALGGVPIMLHASDREWVMRDSPNIQFWHGDTLKLSNDVTLLRCGGHFPGSTALHWRAGAGRKSALFPGDALQVAADRQHVSFMYSYPNYIPMHVADVRAMQHLLHDYAFDNVYGFSRGRNIMGGGRAAVDRSMQRFFSAMAARQMEPAVTE